MTLSASLRTIYGEAIRQSSIERELHARVVREGDLLRIDRLHYDLREFNRVVIVAIGKAAAPMCNHFAALLPEATGIAVGPNAPNSSNIRYLHAGHPLPDDRSLNAARAALELLRALDKRSLVLFLVSGGGSALLEMPLIPEATLEDMREFHQALLYSGLSIVEMNVLRKHASAVKGGRLALAGAPATQCSVLVSDVPGDAGHIVSSGPSLPDPSTLQDCRRILSAHPLGSELIVQFLKGDACPETPKQEDNAFRNAHWITLLSNERLVEHAAQAAKSMGYHAVIDNTCDDWEYGPAAEYLLIRLKKLSQRHPRVCLLSGGEVLVRIAGEAGTGGRNQHFALACALRIGQDFSGEEVAVLSAGSDGIDGNSEAAGAVVDKTTLARAGAIGLDPAESLARFDSGTLFAALGDAIVTGPTNNNLRDLRLLVYERRA